jgi:putative cardiolipin synthase
MISLRHPIRLAALGPALTLLLLGTVCATYDTSYARPESRAYPSWRSAPLAELFAPPADAEPGTSGVELIRFGRVALEARLALADLAEHTLDLQYYIWDPDVSGRLLGEALYRAAERGVRVRLLLDDISIVDRDSELARFSGHPNIEIRAFNPFRHRSRRLGDLFTDPSRVNRRSHNKLMVADNAAAIVGGRNIADHYFGVHGESNYRDLDTFAVGPVVRDASRVFDDFWNSTYAVPYEAFVDAPQTPEDAQAQAALLRERIAADPPPYPIGEDVAALKASLEELRARLVWAPVRVLYDDPSKVEDRSVRGIAGELADLGTNARSEILIENAYFVPRDRLVEVLSDAVARGVRVRVLTNSLASNDVVAVFAGYEKTREELLRNGVELHELRPDSAMKERWSLLSARSRAGLHAKTALFDRRWSVIGSYNLDPRSADINTELVLLVDSPIFAERLAEFLDTGADPANSYRLELEDGRLRWIAEGPDGPIVLETEPETGWWQRFTAGLIGLLPIRSQL